MGCFYSTMNSYMSKDQGNFGVSVHDPFKGKHASHTYKCIFLHTFQCILHVLSEECPHDLSTDLPHIQLLRKPAQDTPGQT